VFTLAEEKALYATSEKRSGAINTLKQLKVREREAKGLTSLC
jgi:hypothetical protein